MFNRKKIKELEAKISSMRKAEDVRDRMVYQLVKIIEKKNAQKKVAEQQIEEYTRRFGEIEQFTGQEPELEPHMTTLAF